MQTEWLKVMLEEVARKREEAGRAQEEAARRVAERQAAAGRTSSAGRPHKSRAGRGGRR